MPELPHISGNEAIKIFVKLGFKIARQRGSHVVLRKENKGCVIPLPPWTANSLATKTQRL